MSNVRPHVSKFREVKVFVRFLAATEGGREAPVSLESGQYRPHLQVSEGEYLGVAFTKGPARVEPGTEANASVALVYEPSVNYSALKESASFKVMEGATLVAVGRVLACM